LSNPDPIVESYYSFVNYQSLKFGEDCIHMRISEGLITSRQQQRGQFV
jgi:hypothetical protein